MALSLIQIPLTAFWQDTATGNIYAPDPNGTILSPNGLYKLSLQTPTHTTTDGNTTTNTFAAPTDDAVSGAYVGDPSYAAQAGARPGSPAPGVSSGPTPIGTSTSTPPPVSVPTYVWAIGAAAVAALLLTSPSKR